MCMILKEQDGGICLYGRMVIEHRLVNTAASFARSKHRILFKFAGLLLTPTNLRKLLHSDILAIV